VNARAGHVCRGGRITLLNARYGACAVQTRYAGAIGDPQCDEEVTPAKVRSRSQRNTTQNGDVDSTETGLWKHHAGSDGRSTWLSRRRILERIFVFTISKSGVSIA